MTLPTPLLSISPHPSSLPIPRRSKSEKEDSIIPIHPPGTPSTNLEEPTMVPPTSTEDQTMQEEEGIDIMGTSGLRLVDYIHISISKLDDVTPPSEEKTPTMNGQTKNEKKKRRRFLDFLKASTWSDWFHHSPFADLDWKTLVEIGKKWARDPANAGIIIWLLVVGAGLLLFFLLISGILNGAIPESSVREKWEEIINQILNALFTIMCLYQHPRLFHHLFLLLRWSPTDAEKLRGTYCSYTSAHEGERLHLSLVVVLLHATCAGQYILCGLYWGYTSTTRPNAGLITCIVFGVAMPVAAAGYTFLGPLGAKEIDEGEKPISAEEGVVMAEPEWAGRLLDCGDDAWVECASLWCTFCVFGWNAERMGFGNVYVHVATFWLICFAPLLVFAVAGMHVEDEEDVRYVVLGVGMALSFLGLMYGGYWRGRMRRRFGIGGGRSRWVADCAVWLMCCCCALAQEVRTVNVHVMEEDKVVVVVGAEGEGKGINGRLRSLSERMGKVEVQLPMRCRSCPGEVYPRRRDGSSRLVEVEEEEEEEERGILCPPLPLVMVDA